jgi:hypothetical protein
MAIIGRNKTTKKILLAIPGQDLDVGTRFVMDIDGGGDAVYEVVTSNGSQICDLCGLSKLCNTSYNYTPRCLRCDRKDKTDVYFRKLD